MADNSSPDYKLRLKQLEERYEQEKGQRKQEEERRKQAEEREKQEAEGRRQEAEGRPQAEEHNQQISFTELLQHCHDLISRQLRSRHHLAQPLAKYPSHRKRLPNSIGTLGQLPRAGAKGL